MREKPAMETNSSIERAVCAAFRVSQLPAIPTQDWGIDAASAMLPLGPGALACAMVAQLDARTQSLRVISTGIAQDNQREDPPAGALFLQDKFERLGKLGFDLPPETSTRGLVAPLAIAGASAWIVFTLASVALALDGADGWLARRNGRASDFGARFDVEVDSAFALVLSLHALDRVGPAVLVLGLARYAFVFAAVLFPWLKRPLPDRFGRKAVCVLQLATLIVLQLPLLPGPAAAGLVAVASLALALSFGRDVVHLWRNRS